MYSPPHAKGLAAHAEVLDLLVATTTLAANSHRAELIFDPFPAVPRPLGGGGGGAGGGGEDQELALDPGKSQEW